jgi:hypothetical protein
MFDVPARRLARPIATALVNGSMDCNVTPTAATDSVTDIEVCGGLGYAQGIGIHVRVTDTLLAGIITVTLRWTDAIDYQSRSMVFPAVSLLAENVLSAYPVICAYGTVYADCVVSGLLPLTTPHYWYCFGYK